MSEIRFRLLSLRDEAYRTFQEKLLPTVPRERILGVRTPVLRRLAKEMAGTPQAASFLKKLPHRYWEENNLHAFLIEEMKEYDPAIDACRKFLPYIDNWATCDSFSPPVFRRHPEALWEEIGVWLASGHVYTVRFGLCMLMRQYLRGEYRDAALEKAAAVPTEEYYLSMGVAWLFSAALAECWKEAVVYLEAGKLDVLTHNRAIRKGLDSLRLSAEQKAYLRTLRRT